VLLAKHFRSHEWNTLSVPKNRSADFNRFLAERQAEGIAKGDRMEAPLEFVESEREEQAGEENPAS
jgi:hypothetical protein